MKPNRSIRYKDSDTLLAVENLVVVHALPRGATVHAVSDISLTIRKGETLGLVGESGCGKSSLARAVMQLPRPTSGRVTLGDVELTALPRRALQRQRRRFQIIFQDPISSLNPRRRIGDVVAAPLAMLGHLDRPTINKRVAEILDQVGLNAQQAMGRRPHEFSGGQCQRISIARSLIVQPELLICDEPVSALDVSVQAQILNVLQDLKQQYGLTMLFISHDLAVVKHVSDRVAVMYLGKLCELAPAESIYRYPAHPYTRSLLSAVPIPDPNRPMQPNRHPLGEIPSPTDPPSGCRFRTRCPQAQAQCATHEPPWQRAGPDHWVACHFAELAEY